MTSIVSAISGQFSKSLILGTFLPVSVFVFLAWICGESIFPSGWPLFEPLKTLDTQWQALAVSLVIIVLSGLLYNLNIPIIRLYEGYPWQHSWIGEKCIRRQQDVLYALQARWAGLLTLVRALEPGEVQSRILHQRGRIGRRINGEFPARQDLVLPTRLGNVIRSFEYYPDVQYSIDAIEMWPRLIAKIDQKYAATLDDSKTSFDFMLNSSVLSAVLALATLIFGVLYAVPVNEPSSLPIWFLEMVGFIALCYFFYQRAIERAGAWGALVKSAFDLYRWELLKQLGYRQLPSTRDNERTLWNHIALQTIFGDSPHGPRLDYADDTVPTTTTFAKGRPDGVALQVARGVKRRWAGRAVAVILCVRNNDQHGQEAENVIVTDTLPDGFEYEWDSAYVNNRSVPVEDTNPYRFSVGYLAPGGQLILSYRAVPFKK